MSVTAVRSGAADERPAHRDPNVLRWVGAYTSLVIGDKARHRPVLGRRPGRTPAQAGLVSAAGAVPRALLMLGGEWSPTGSGRVAWSSAAARCAVLSS